MGALIIFLIAAAILLAVVGVFFALDAIDNYVKRGGFRNSKSKRKRTKSGGEQFYDRLPDSSVIIDADLVDKWQSHQQSLISSDEVIFDEYCTDEHECLVVVLSDSRHVVTICAFLKDMTVEYAVQALPKEVEAEAEGDSTEAQFRLCAAAVAAWEKKWVYVEAVNFLCQDRALVKSLNQHGSTHRRFMRHFERRREFNLFFQWTDNYMCDEIAREELWESLILVARRLLAAEGNEKSEDLAWKKFVLEHWHRTRINLDLDSFKKISVAKEKHAEMVSVTNEKETVNDPSYVSQDLVAV